MNIGRFMSHYEGGKASIHIGHDMECVFDQTDCPHLQCTGKRNLKRALYHKIRYIRMSDGDIFIGISPFYEESKEFNLRDLLMVNLIDDVQIDDNIRISGLPLIGDFIKTDDPVLYRVVKEVSIIEGTMIITLMPSIDNILDMLK